MGKWAHDGEMFLEKENIKALRKIEP